MPQTIFVSISNHFLLQYMIKTEIMIFVYSDIEVAQTTKSQNHDTPLNLR